MTFICNTIFILFMVGYFPVFLMKLRQATDKKRLVRDRIGLYSDELMSYVQGHDVIWLHAVSVGEVMAAQVFLKKLYAAFPKHRIILSTVTPTGNTVAHKIANGMAKVFYFPLDISWITNKIMKQLKPKLIILMETELWPNLIMSAHAHGVKISIVNGRISPRSFRNYYGFKRLLKPVFSLVDLYLVQTDRYAKRLKKVGVPDDRIRVMGNMKFDAVEAYQHDMALISAKKKELGFADRDTVLIAASTHRGEERIICETVKQLRPTHPQLKVVLAPRHIERAEELGTLVTEYGFSYRYAHMQGERSFEKKPFVEKPDIYILNTIGELKKLYAIADVVFMGGSLIPHGGQNPLEPLAFQKPLITGPHVHNFSDIYDMLQKQTAVIVISSAKDLLSACESLCDDPHAAHAMGARGYAWLQHMKGASDRACNHMRELVNVS